MKSFRLAFLTLILSLNFKRFGIINRKCHQLFACISNYQVNDPDYKKLSTVINFNKSFHLKYFYNPTMKLSIVWLVFIFFALTSYHCSNKEKQMNNLIDTLDSPNQFIESAITLETATANIYGTLNATQIDEQTPLVIIIAGSGPTDHNGNNTTGLQTNAYKMISDTLAKHGVASLRYDKRGIAESYFAGFREEDLRFEDYINDASEWVKKMQKDDAFSDIFILGHSEGSLIGMLAVQETDVSGFISVAGPAQSADALILEQLVGQPQEIIDEAETILNALNQGMLVHDVSQFLYALFRPSVQPYLISWLKYDPVEEIARINEPLMVIHGSTDLQVKSSEAQQLAEANPNAELTIIDFMNHVLKNAGDDIQTNLATYSNPNLPLNTEFCKVLTKFIKENIKE